MRLLAHKVLLITFAQISCRFQEVERVLQGAPPDSPAQHLHLHDLYLGSLLRPRSPNLGEVRKETMKWVGQALPLLLVSGREISYHIASRVPPIQYPQGLLCPPGDASITSTAAMGLEHVVLELDFRHRLVVFFQQP